MADADSIQTAMTQAAEDGVTSTSFSAGSSSQSQMSAREQIEVINFLRANTAQSRNHRGIGYQQIQPAGARNDG